MFDALLARLFKPVLDRLGGRFGGPLLALAAFVIGLGAVPLITRQVYLIGFGVFVLSRLLSSIAAHAPEPYPAGPVLEVVGFAALPFAFALADPSISLQAVLMMVGLAAWSSAFLVFGRGFIAGAELLIAFGIAAAFPGWFGLVAYGTCVLCAVSAGIQLGNRRPS